MSRRLLCFGDSNTYGYDPRSPLGGPYPDSVRWTALLNQETDWEILNCGQNGRAIPWRPWELDQVNQLLLRCGRLDGFLVMLGANDLLQQPGCTAEDVAGRMEQLLVEILDSPALGGLSSSVMLVAPPPMQPGSWVSEDRLLIQSQRLGPCYGEIARRLGCRFADAGRWDIPLSFDGVHFSPLGHQRFARHITTALKSPWPVIAGSSSDNPK